MLRMKQQSVDDYPDTGEELHILVHKEDKYIPGHKQLLFHIILRIRYYMEPLGDLCCCL